MRWATSVLASSAIHLRIDRHRSCEASSTGWAMPLVFARRRAFAARCH